MHITLTKPGYDVADETNGAINLDYAGDGIVLRSIGAGSPKPTYYANAQEAKEAIVYDTYEYLQAGWRIAEAAS